VEFMLSSARDAVSAEYPLGAFFRKALRARHTVPPRVIKVDRNPAYPKAVCKLKGKGTGTVPQGCKLRPVKYLNNLVEQDHRFIKRRTNPGMGCERSELVVRHSMENTSGLRGNASIEGGSG
jgi:transposase, IS6 family